MAQQALQKGCLTAPWRFPAAPRLGNYGAAAVARLLFGSLSDAKGTRTTLPSAAITASGGEGRSLGSSCRVSEEVTSGGASHAGPPAAFMIGRLRASARSRPSGGAHAGLCRRAPWARESLGVCCSWGSAPEVRQERKCGVCGPPVAALRCR